MLLLASDVAKLSFYSTSRGRKADQYLVGQADKGCFLYTPRELPVAQEEQPLKRIGLVVNVKAPYAVFLKN